MAELMDRNKIYNEDCFESMSSHLKSKSIDIILTSPPYNMTKRKGGISDTGRYDVYTDWKSEEDYIKWTNDLFCGFDNILKDDGVVLYNFSYSIENPSLPYKLVPSIEKETNFRLIDTIVWKKKCGIPFPANKYRLSRIFEYVFVFTKKEHMNNYTNNRRIKSVSEKTGQSYYEVEYNFIEADNNDGKCKLNQATFSSDLVKQLLKIYCNQEEKRIVYDPFMGTGTTAIGCINYDAGENKVEYFGSEISKEQCEYAEERIAKEKRKYAYHQVSLFDYM
jgi:site-specific DNA-methyltransferase (adenine-specific)